MSGTVLIQEPNNHLRNRSSSISAIYHHFHLGTASIFVWSAIVSYVIAIFSKKSGLHGIVDNTPWHAVSDEEVGTVHDFVQN